MGRTLFWFFYLPGMLLNLPLDADLESEGVRGLAT
jgi:hypothetical protein